MENLITKINGKEISVKEYQGQRVVTFKDIDTVHERVEGTAGRNFRDNKSKFIENEDYFKVCADEIRTHKIMEISNKTHESIILITESGYLMLVKSLSDDLAWKVQRELVNNYFKNKKADLIIKQLNNTILDLQQKFYNLENDIDNKIQLLTQQGLENHRPSHKTKLDWNRVIKTYSICKGDEEALKQFVLVEFNAEKWDDIPYYKNHEVLYYIRYLAEKLNMFTQVSMFDREDIC